MKRAVWMTSTILIVSLLAFAPPALAVNNCSNATLQGSFGLAGFGNIAPVGPFATGGAATALAGPFADLAVLAFDGSGNITSGAAITSVNGVSALTNFTGTYTVNANCAGTAQLVFSAPQSTTTGTPTGTTTGTTTGTAPANPFNPGQASSFRFVTVNTGTGGTGTGTGTGGTGTGQTASSVSFGQAILNFVIVGDGDALLFSLADTGTVITGRAERQQVPDR